MSYRMRFALIVALLVAVVVGAFGAVVFGTYQVRINSGADQPLRDFLTVFVVAGATAILLAVLLGWFGGRGASRRITQLARALRSQQEAADLEGRVPVPRGRTEMVELSTALNASLERIQRTSHTLETRLTQQRRFLADAARTLRRPLSAMARALGEVQRRPDMLSSERDAAIDRSLTEVDAMGRLVDGLDLLARLESGQGGPHGPFEWTSFVRIAATRGRQLCAPRTVGLDVSPELRGGFGDVQALQELVGILFANVALHTPPSTRVTLSVAPSRVGDADEIAVSDDGPGVPQALLERMFDPFVSGDPTRCAGLGLAIARAIAISHGGSITPEPNQPRGLRMMVVLPHRAAQPGQGAEAQGGGQELATGQPPEQRQPVSAGPGRR